jgi:hypothetical protein
LAPLEEQDIGLVSDIQERIEAGTHLKSSGAVEDCRPVESDGMAGVSHWFVAFAAKAGGHLYFSAVYQLVKAAP